MSNRLFLPECVAESFRSLTVEEGDIREIRIHKAVVGGKPPRTYAGLFCDSEAVVKALSIVDAAPAFYITLNPIHPTAVNRPMNQLTVADLGQCANASCILRRDWLPVDIDPVRPRGWSSDDAQHRAALEMGLQIATDLKEAQFPEPIRGDSGNGGHLLYRVDLPAEDEGLIQAFLKHLASRYSTPDVAVDSVVFDPARIWKLYGSMACKGAFTQDRPHRMSRILSIPCELQVVPQKLLRQMCGSKSEPHSTPSQRDEAGRRKIFVPATYTPVPRNEDSAGQAVGTSEELFRSAMADRGLVPPISLVTDGKFQRCGTISHPNKLNGSYCLDLTPIPHGGFQNWEDACGWQPWSVPGCPPMTHDQRAECEARKTAARKDQVIQTEAAAHRAAALWNDATACIDHPYLKTKGVGSHGLRVMGDLLLVPLYAPTGEMASLQQIHGDGSKRFLKYGRKRGCYYLLGKSTDGPICIAEGYATAASIFEATGFMTAVAFDSANLRTVAEELRAAWPERELLFCGDDDLTFGNPGATKAEEAAKLVAGRLALPWWMGARPEGGSDFNDLAVAKGLGAVRACIQAVRDGWNEPQPLVADMHREPFPIEALPGTIRKAVEEVREFVQAPVALIASSALGALSLAAQSHWDIKRAERLEGPVSLYLLGIADSGERKSTCDGFFMRAIQDYESKQALLAVPLVQRYEADMKVWDAKCDGIKAAIRKLASKGQDADDPARLLRELEGDKPVSPRFPRLLYADATPESLKAELAKNWPSGGVVSSEAGVIFGSHGMNADSVMRNLSTLNLLWDGAELATDRRSSESFVVRGARLTIALQVQPATLQSFFDRAGDLPRGSGFIARFLLAWPESTQGTRIFRDPPENWPMLTAFNQRLSEILNLPVAMDQSGALTPELLSFTPEARSEWIAFYNRIERELSASGRFSSVRDVASKIADNAARIACLFHVFEADGSVDIQIGSMQAACQIAEWHLNESLRFFSSVDVPEGLAKARDLGNWLTDRCRRKESYCIPTMEVLQYGPSKLRKKEEFDSAMHQLSNLSRARIATEGKRRFVVINPVLLG